MTRADNLVAAETMDVDTASQRDDRAECTLGRMGRRGWQCLGIRRGDALRNQMVKGQGRRKQRWGQATFRRV